MEICKYCNSQMIGEYETLTSSNHYKFFFTCPKCGAVFEGERKNKGPEIILIKSRWFNPNTKQFEE